MSIVRIAMATFFEFTYNCIYQLNQYFRTFWPVKILFGKHLKPPSTDTELTVLRVLYLFKHQQDGSDALILELLNSLPADEDIFCIRDQNTGYNLLQFAVIHNKRDIVISLLSRCCQNVEVFCSPPVHIAAFLGYNRILENLLEHGAGSSSDIQGMCYPDPHVATKYQRWFGIFDYPVFRCKLNAQLPIYSAISQDNLECVKLLLKHMSESNGLFLSPSSLLHYSCQRGAENCIQYFVSKYPEEINTVDWTTKDTPLLAAVVWGSKCARILIDNGADVKTVSKTGETALHRLYRNDIDGLFSIYDTTKYLLTTGIEQLVNWVNDNGETPLHVLVTHVSYIGGELLHPDQGQGQVVRSQLQPDYQDQVVNSLESLLQFNADPHLQNRYGLQPLNKLMHIALNSCCPDDKKCSCVAMSISSKYIYKNDFKHLKKAIEVLLQHDSDANAQCNIGHTPFILLLQCLLYMGLDELVNQQIYIIETLEILLNYGANPNFITSDEATCSTFIAKIAMRYFENSLSDTGMVDDTTQVFSDLVNEVLEVLLRYGLNPNYVSTKRMPHLKGGTGNSLVEFVSLTSLANSTLDFIVVHKWLKTLFKWGANPDLEPYPSEPVICHSQSSIFLKKQGTQAMSHYIHELNGLNSLFQDGNAEELLMLFYNTMSHKKLYDCLNVAKYMSRFSPYSATTKDFYKLLCNLSENPRSLKQIVRVSIYQALDRKLSTSVPMLPLPTAMKNYLLEIE